MADIELGTTSLAYNKPPGLLKTAGPIVDGGNGSEQTSRTQLEQNTDQGDPLEKLFSIYTAKASEYDKELWESWNGDMDGIMIFVSDDQGWSSHHNSECQCLR